MPPRSRQAGRRRLAGLAPLFVLALGACSDSNDGNAQSLLNDIPESPAVLTEEPVAAQEPPTGGTPDPSGPNDSVALPPGLLERVQVVFDAATVQALEPVVPVSRALRSLYRNGIGDDHFALTGSRTGSNILFDNDTGAPYLSFDCVDGGTVEANIGTTASFVDAGKYAFDNCIVGPITLEGTINEFPARIDAASGETGLFSLQGFSYADARDGTVRESTGAPGAVQLTTATGETAGLRSARVRNDSITIRSTSPDSYLDVTELSTDITAATHTGADVQMTTAFLIRFAPDGPRATVRTVDPFRRSVNEPLFTSGSLRVTGDNYALTLDADGGDPTSFTLDLEQDGTRTAWTVSWSDVTGVEPFDPGSVVPGF